MLSSKVILLLLIVFLKELIISNVCAVPLAPPSGLDLSEVLIFDSDPPAVSSSKVLASDPTKSLAIPNITEHDAEEFLQSFGYDDIESDTQDLSPRSGFTEQKTLRDRIRKFQRDSGLDETGVLDDDTKITMGSPRCGVRMSEKRGDVMKWNKNTLTYRISNQAAGVSPSIVSAYVKKAFNEWSKVTNIDFVERADPRVDIEISFGGQYHLRRGLSCFFAGFTDLAHAFFPSVGDIHFNSMYYFSNGGNMDDFLNTAIHEIGHSLGLEHSNSRGVIMFPSQIRGVIAPQSEDIKRIQALYGARRGARSITHNAPSFCSLTKYDAALDDKQGNWYIFSGNYYYAAFDPNPTAKLISSKWPGITGRIDAAFRFPDGKTYFFKGNRFWRYRGSRLEPGYPRLISEGFPGVPDNVDAIFVDGQNRVFVLKGSRYWVYDYRKAGIHSYSLKSQSLPSNFDSAIDSGGKIVVFKGKIFYRFENGAFKEYTNSWMSC